MTLNRVVVLLTPVFAAGAGWLTEWVALHFPGTPTLDKGQLTALFITGATAGLAQAAHWLHGWQKDESHQAERHLAALNLTGELEGTAEGVKAKGFEPAEEQ